MKHEEFLNFLHNIGKDPSRLIFEDELTGLYNRRFLLNYFEYKVRWNALSGHPLSIILMDVDYFKKINDTFGHHVGDQALIWVADLLKEISGDSFLPIRYAGDEFIILIPEGEKKIALETGERLLRRVREKPFSIQAEGQERPFTITLSLGVASAPEDATSGKALLQRADTALYFAKKEGRDRLAHATEVRPQVVFDKAALYQLEGERIAGRGIQLSRVSDFIQKLTEGQSHFLIIEGAPGMGKTTFLEAVRRNLMRHSILLHSRVSGNRQEISQPYYLFTQIIASLLNQKEDRGRKIFSSLTPQEIFHLREILPQLDPSPDGPGGKDHQKRREGLFNTLLYFLPKAVENRPLALLIDDLDYADEATLLLIRQLFLRHPFPLLLCGTSRELGRIQFEEKGNPLEAFFEAHEKSLNIQRIGLPPLAEEDITEHLLEIFPKVQIPPNFTKQLAQITEGNPLFLGALLRQLVFEQNIKLVGQQWVIETMDPEVLPRTLEVMIRQRISTLDDESRQILDRASALGESLSLSLLTGAAKKSEARILEFVDQAKAIGLLRTDFEWNDETIRFISRRIQEIAEATISPQQKPSLHEEIGTYQESLYQKRLWASAAPLVYHFKRSTNQEKARTYERFQALYRQRIFDPGEALQYTGERRSELLPPGNPLDPVSLAQVPAVLRSFLTALRNIRLYPPGSDSVVGANRQFKEGLDRILEKNENLTIFQVRQALMVNGQRVDTAEFRVIVEEFFKFLNRVELQGIIFHRGVSEQEIQRLVEALGLVKPKIIDRDYWYRFTAEQELAHIELKQMRYTLMVESDGSIRGRPPLSPSIPQQVLMGTSVFEREDWLRIHEIIRNLLNAAKNIKLYPIHSPSVSASVEQLIQSLRPVLLNQPALTFARTGNFIVVNGQRMDTVGIETLVEGFGKFLDDIMLQSLTFLETITDQDLHTFIGAFSQVTAGGRDGDFWHLYSKEHGLSSILFNQVFYETRVTSSSAFGEDSGEGGEGWREEMEPIEEERFEVFLRELPLKANDFLIDGQERKLRQLLQRLFFRFQDRSFLHRERTLEGCAQILGEMTLAHQYRFGALLADPLLVSLAQERDPKILRDLANLLYRIGICAVQFADYPLASRVFLRLQQRHRELTQGKDANAHRFAKILERRLDPAIQKQIWDEIRSGDAAREQNVALLLGSLGRVGMPLLVELIKKGETLRLREMAANLLKEMGTEGADLLKKELVFSSDVEEKIRILDVLDTVTKDLKLEIHLILQNDPPELRPSVFRLMERMNNTQAVELLLHYIQNHGRKEAIPAIESLGRLKPALGTLPLLSLLQEAKEKEWLIACCRALGQLGDPAAIDPLARILSRRNRFFLGRKKRREIRAAAAFALGQIPHLRATQILASFAKDHDPIIREISRHRLSQAKPQIVVRAGGSSSADPGASSKNSS
jgi:diguanylate cyclase (GGDEF)-like protein